MQCSFGNEPHHASYLEVDKTQRVVNAVCWEHKGKMTDGRYILFVLPFWSEKKDPTPAQLERHEEYLAITWNMPLIDPDRLGMKFRPMRGNAAKG